MASYAIVRRGAVGRLVRPAVLVLELAAGLVGLLVHGVASVLRGVRKAITGIGDLVVEGLLAVGLSPRLLEVGFGVPNGLLQVSHLGSLMVGTGVPLVSNLPGADAASRARR